MAGGGGKMMAAPTRRQDPQARALWYAGKGAVELREAPLPPLGTGEARVRTLFSGISRGTERLVLQRGNRPQRVGAHALPDAGGRLPVPREIRLLRGRSRGGRPGRSPRPQGLLPASPPGRIPRAGRPPGAPSPTGSRRAAPRSPPTWRPRSTRCGTAAPGRATASWWWAPGWWGCWSHPWPRGCPARR